MANKSNGKPHGYGLAKHEIIRRAVIDKLESESIELSKVVCGMDGKMGGPMPPAPTVHMANVRFLQQWLEELQLQLADRNKDACT